MPENDLDPNGAYYLTKEDVLFLRMLKEEHSHRRINPYSRPAVEDPVQTAPEVYVALTPSGGIPAISEVPGTGSGTAGRVLDTLPGSATCDIFRVLPNASSGLPELEPAFLKKTVLNVYLTLVSGNRFWVVKRDKWGSWLAENPGGGAISDGILGDVQFANGSGGFKNYKDVTSNLSGSAILIKDDNNNPYLSLINCGVSVVLNSEASFGEFGSMFVVSDQFNTQHFYVWQVTSTGCFVLVGDSFSDDTVQIRGVVNIGASSDTMGFYGQGPVVQPSTTGTTAGFTPNASANTVFNESTFTGGTGSKAYTISDVVLALKHLGLMKKS